MPPSIRPALWISVDKRNGPEGRPRGGALVPGSARSPVVRDDGAAARPVLRTTVPYDSEGPPMHLRRVLALGAAATVLPLLPAAPAMAAGTRPACGDPAATAFPLRGRLSGGPLAYRPGGAGHTFTLELTNTTAQDCRAVHPLVVVVDRGRMLTPRQMRLDFADPASGAWRTVDFETSDDNEKIGLPGGEGGTGFTVPAHGSLTVRLRLAFTPDAPRDRVVVSATTMQRRGDDGAWIGESNHYAFDIGGAGAGQAAGAPAQLAATGARQDVLAALGGIAAALMLGGAALVAAARGRAGRPR